MSAMTLSEPLRASLRLPRWLSSEHPFPWLLPASALMIVLGIYPLAYAVWLSLHKRNPVLRTNVFDPTHNWARAFADGRVWHAIGDTFLYTGIALAIELVLGLLIALLLDTDRRGYGLLRALMTLPLVLWFSAIRHFAAKTTITPSELALVVGIRRQATAREMIRRMRAALREDNVGERFAGLARSEFATYYETR